MRGQSLLTRFRPVGAPGGAGPVGVPADAEDTAAAELGPVFDALAPVLVECARIRRDAAAAAAALLAHAGTQAQALISQAESEAGPLRADAVAAVHHRTRLDSQRLVDEAQAEAQRLTRRGHDRLPGMVADLVAELRGDLGLQPPGDQP